MKITEIEQDDPTFLIETHCQPFLQQVKPGIPLDQKPKLYRGMDIGGSKPIYKLGCPIDRSPRDTDLPIHFAFTRGLKEAGFIASRDNSIFTTGSFNYATTYVDHDSNYVFSVYPIGDFSFTWSPQVKDMANQYWIVAAAIDVSKADEAFESSMLKNTNMKTRFMEYLYHRNPKLRPLPSESLGDLINAFYDIWKRFCKDDIKYQVNIRFLADIVDYKKLAELLKDQLHYTNENLEKAIDSQCEIMIHCESYYAVRYKPKPARTL